MARSTAGRVPTTISIDPKGQAVVQQSQTFAPFRAQVFRHDQLDDPHSVSRALNLMQQSISDATLAARSNNRNVAVTFENLLFDAALTPSAIKLDHNLGTKVRWCVVRWRKPDSGPVTACGIFEPTDGQKNNNVLVLEPSFGARGLADVEVWSA